MISLTYELLQGASDMPMSVKELKSDLWEQEVSNADGIIAVYFWAPWCGHCKAFSPVFEKVATDMKARAVFAKVNCDDETSIVDACGVKGMPTVIIYKDGVELNRHTGEESAENLSSRIEEYLAG